MAVRPWWVVTVARASAAGWQRVACNPETLPPDRVLALLCCGPLHLLLRFAAFLCVPFIPAHRFASPRRRRAQPHRLLLLPPPEVLLERYSPSPSSSSSSSSSDEDDDDDDDDYGGIENGDIHPHVD